MEAQLFLVKNLAGSIRNRLDANDGSIEKLLYYTIFIDVAESVIYISLSQFIEIA